MYFGENFDLLFCHTAGDEELLAHHFGYHSLKVYVCDG